MSTKKLIISMLVMIFAASWVWAAPKEGKAGFDWWGPAPGQKPVVAGKVSNISATNIAVQTKEGIKTFTVDSKTKVRVRGSKATINDVKVGNPVVVDFKLLKDNVPLAIAIVVPKPSYTGEITSIQNTQIVIRERIPAQKSGKVRGKKKQPPYTLGEERKVLVTNNTKIHSREYIGSINDLRVGMLINAIGTINEQVLTADAINFTPATAKGTVTAVDGNSITVKTVRQLTLSLQASPATAVLVRPRVGPNTKGTLDNVKVGVPVNIGFIPNDAGASPLLWIDVLTGI